MSCNDTDQCWFTIRIVSSWCGVTDQLLQFRSLFLLGHSLGYAYVHTPFSAPRSSTRPSQHPKARWGWPRWARRLAALRRPYVQRGLHSRDVFNFLGFNDYLARMSEDRPKGARVIKISLADATLQRAGVTNAGSLCHYVRDQVHKTRGRPILVELALSGTRDFLAWIHCELPVPQDFPNLRKAYGLRRREDPRPDQFQGVGPRILVHVRQGDTALIRTPWKSYIPIWMFAQHRFTERDHPDANSISISDYRDVVVRILGLTASDAEVLVFSDGYKRAFDLLFRNLDRLGLDRERRLAIGASQASYDQSEFEPLARLPSSTLAVEETNNSLYDLIHASLSADIVVVGPIQRMIPKFLACYCDERSSPLIVMLHRGKPPDWNVLGASHLDVVNVALQMPDSSAALDAALRRRGFAIDHSPNE